MVRSIKDALLSVTKACPAAGANNNSDSIDLGSVTAEAAPESFDVLITAPALPALVDAKNATITLQDSADNAAFAAIPGLATFVRTGAGGAGAAAATRQVKLPASTRRYLRFNNAVDAAGGDSTAKSITLDLVF